MKQIMVCVVMYLLFIALFSRANDVAVVYKARTGEVCGCARGGDYVPRIEVCEGLDMGADLYEIIHVSTCR